MLFRALGYFLSLPLKGGPNENSKNPGIYDIIFKYIFFERSNWREFLVAFQILFPFKA